MALLALISDVTAQNDSSSSLTSKKLLLLPVIARSVETGWMFGGVASSTFRISKKDTLSRTSNMQALGLYSLKRQLVTVLNGAIYTPQEKYIINYRLSYSYFPDKFWGIGKHAPDSAEEPYQFKQFYMFLHGMRKVSPGLFVGAVYELQRVMQVTYQKDGLFDKEKVPGRKGYLVSGFGGSITYDNRNNAFAPDKGTFLQLTAKYYMPAFGSDYSYSNIVQDIRQYIPIGKKNVLALQWYNFMNVGGDIPLRSLAILGGDACMRGYYSGRFRDKNLMALQAEWRMPVYKRWGVVAFGGTGDVANKVLDYNFNDLKYAYGGGVRFALNQQERLNLRLDYGFTSNNTQGFYLQLAEAF